MSMMATSEESVDLMQLLDDISVASDDVAVAGLDHNPEVVSIA